MKKNSGIWDVLCPFFDAQTGRIMRLTFLFLFIGLMQVTASSYSQTAKLKLDFSQTKVKDVLEAIEEQSKFRFAYSSEIVDLNRQINIRMVDQDIESVLGQVFKDTNVKYEIDERHIILYTAENSGVQQSLTIQGTVVDEAGVPLPGVTVFVKSTTMGTVTDLDGVYQLSEVKSGSTLVFSFVGMRTQEILINNQTSLDITMFVDAIGVEEIVAIGYGKQKKSDLTGAVYSVKAEELETLPNTNIMQGLQGKVPGLNITNIKSSPGEAPRLRIRGENSLSASNNPLIVLDGIPFEGNLNDINPGDIESASVLKDASSAAIYGARAANGVILITTKRGKAGKVQVNYRGYYGVQTVENKLDLLDGPAYVKFLQDYNGFSGKEDLSPENLLMSDEIPQYEAGIETDWQDLVFSEQLLSKIIS